MTDGVYSEKGGLLRDEILGWDKESISQWSYEEGLQRLEKIKESLAHEEQTIETLELLVEWADKVLMHCREQLHGRTAHIREVVSTWKEVPERNVQ